MVSKFSRGRRIDFLRALEGKSVLILSFKLINAIDKKNSENLENEIRVHTGRAHSSPSSGRSPDLWVRVLAFPFFSPGQNTIVKLYYTSSLAQYASR